jgi:hypothetical protein
MMPNKTILRMTVSEVILRSKDTYMIWRWFWCPNGTVIVIVDAVCRVLFIDVLPPSPPPPTNPRR